VQVAREFGIDAYGVDEIHPNDARKPEYLGYITNEGAKNDGLVVADAKHLPFRDSVFDYVCTHSSVPLYGDPSPEDIKAHVAEMLRVVKDGGEVRIHPFLKETGIWPFRNMNSKHRENQRKFLALFPNAEIRAEFAIVRK
jgi:ubiquinone/menaquinone biosynthesis C-methylase UbiE